MQACWCAGVAIRRFCQSQEERKRKEEEKIECLGICRFYNFLEAKEAEMTMWLGGAFFEGGIGGMGLAEGQGAWGIE